MVPVLADMERTGIKVDRDTLSRMSNAFSQKMAGLEDEIYELAGRKFNVGSPKQLGEILFDEMGLEGGKKGKTGAYATGADVLEDLATEHALPARVLDWRQLSKLKSTYTDALQDHINPDTGRCAPTQAAVNMSNCAYESTIGASQLSALWKDESYSATQNALYYARVIENPTCRYSASRRPW